MRNTQLREYDKNLDDCYSEIAIESIDPIVILKLCLLEYLFRLSNQHKTKNHGECHKNAHSQLKTKHNKKCNNEEHHNHMPLACKGEDKNHVIFGTNGEGKNHVPLENNAENKSYVLLEDNREDTKIHNVGKNFGIVEKEELPKKVHNNQMDKGRIVNCKPTVTSEMLPLCENIPHSFEVTVAPVIVKIPVVLTECTVTIIDKSSLKLEDNILEIKHIRKNVYLNQCKLIPHSENGKFNSGVLFIDGFIRKNIEYTTKEHNRIGVSCEKIKHITVKVPFKCATRITFKTQPRFKPNISTDEVEILKTSIKVFEPCGEDVIGRDILEQSFKLVEFFNEKVYCELISAEIIESDILENSINKECKTPLEEGFHDITEKVVISLTIKLLQKQDVEIPKKD